MASRRRAKARIPGAGADCGCFRKAATSAS
jgi:hypothetical protein